MENSPQNVAIFQFIFIDQEMIPFIQTVTKFGNHIQMKLVSLEKEKKQIVDPSGIFSLVLKKNFLFSHCFKFDIERMSHLSSELKTLFIKDFHQFKKVISEISYRIIKGILSKKIHLDFSQQGGITEKIIDNIIDRCQVRVSIEPFNLPFENSGFHSLNGIISVGHHFFLTGRVTNIDQPKHIIIRRLYRCKNPNCRNTFYLHINDTMPSSNTSEYSFLETSCANICCEKCNELASEDETGRIMSSFQKFSILPASFNTNIGYRINQNSLFFSDYITNYKYFSFFPQIELKVKDFNKNNNYKCSELLMVGNIIDVIGTTFKHNARIICEPNFSFSFQDLPLVNQLIPNPKDYFVEFISRIENFFPVSKCYKSFHRIATAVLCAVSSSSQLLFIVKTSEDLKILIHFLIECVLEPFDCDVFLPNEKGLFKGNLQNFARQQERNEQQEVRNNSQPQPPGLLSKKSVIIYHLESITNKNREKLIRTVSQKSVSGCKFVQMTLIGILVSEFLESSQISLYDSFPMVVRVESFPRKLFINLFIDNIDGNGNESDLDDTSDLFIRAPNEESLVLQIRQDFKKITISEEGQALIDNFIAYIDQNSNLNENQIESAISGLHSDSSMINFANSGLNISPESIVNNAKAIAAIRGDLIASEDDVVLSIYFFEERLTALCGSNNNELDQFPPTTGSFFCAGISAIPTKDESTLYSCYCSILSRIIK